MCQCRWPTQTYIQKIVQKHCFFQCFYIFFRQKRRNLHVFGLKSVQNSGFCSVFNALASKNHSKYRYLQCFSFLSVFPLPEADQNDPKFRFNILLSSDTQNHRKNTQTPPIRGLGAKSRLAPPPAKADIATAILTNVIKHLV